MNQSALHIPPEFIRLPKPGARCPHTGLSRTTLFQLIVPSKANDFRPPVRSIYRKASKYATRGLRLVNYRSLIDHLHSLEGQQ